MKLLTVLSLFVVATIAQAKPTQVECRSKYFNRDQIPVVLRFEASSDARISRLELRIGGEMVRKGVNLRGREYDGRKYKEMMAFVLEGKNIQIGSWGDFSMALLLPQGFSGAEWGARFKGIITESASDGGSYNTVLCQAIN